ncbi:MAG: LytR/AlgR family response regulator transcription factor [Prevotella fusca]|uniref:LytR/AlgR family response regulator transcription factor n=1 Tax=Prevotella fusca TaxID=589436 RepID=UPI003FA014FC
MKVRNALLIKHRKFQKMCISTFEGFELIFISDIIYLEADGAYTYLYMENGTRITATKNLGFYEEELCDEPFLRIHQSFIVNINKVKQYLKVDNGYVIMSSGKPIKVSRSKKDELMEFFKIRRAQNKN